LVRFTPRVSHIACAVVAFKPFAVWHRRPSLNFSSVYLQAQQIRKASSRCIKFELQQSG
jgi:hypothetical protein